MLVQKRADGLRLIRQNDHALLAGRLATEWVGFEPQPDPLPFRATLAIALHDLAWARVDREPELAPTGLPYAFDTVDDPYRLPLYAAGLDELERIDPYAALMASRHYLRFLPIDPEFAPAEEARQKRLQKTLGASVGESDQLQYLLRHLDFLSLFLCLTDPAAIDPAKWLEPEFVGQAPGGTYQLAWADDQTVTANPFPFRRSLSLEWPIRDLPAGPFSSQEALDAAWAAAPPRSRRVRLEP